MLLLYLTKSLSLLGLTLTCWLLLSGTGDLAVGAGEGGAAPVAEDPGVMTGLAGLAGSGTSGI